MERERERERERETDTIYDDYWESQRDRERLQLDRQINDDDDDDDDTSLTWFHQLQLTEYVETWSCTQAPIKPTLHSRTQDMWNQPTTAWNSCYNTSWNCYCNKSDWSRLNLRLSQMRHSHTELTQSNLHNAMPLRERIIKSDRTETNWHIPRQKKKQWKKRSEETQTLHTGCSKAEPTIFAPPQTRFPGAWDGQNLLSCRWSLTTFTYRPSLVRIDARNFRLSW